MGTDAGGKGVDPNSVEGNWNENVGGASKTERPETMYTTRTVIPRIFDRSRILEVPKIRAPFQRLVRRIVYYPRVHFDMINPNNKNRNNETIFNV